MKKLIAAVALVSLVGWCALSPGADGVLAATSKATTKTVKIVTTNKAKKKDCRRIEVNPGQFITACAVVTTVARRSATTVRRAAVRAQANTAAVRIAPTVGPTTTVPLAAGTTTVPLAAGTTTVPPSESTAATTSVAPAVAIAGDPNAPTTITGVAPTVPATSGPPTSALASTTTTTTTPYPGPAAAPSRPIAATLDPMKGLGTWVDVFDWTVQFGGPKPKFTSATVDAIAAAGVQTIYIQATKWDAKSDVAEPERLLPIIGRAHQLGLNVVVWYLPALTDVNLDLRRTVAIANLDVDGISIDIETNRVKDLAERNRRIITYSTALRELLPGRLISATVLPPVDTDSPTYKLWPKLPYGAIGPYYDGWILMGYWTSWKAASGWRDGYIYTRENIARLRSYLGRPDAPIHYAGGVGNAGLTAWDVGGMIKASQEAGIIGASVYDWITTDSTFYSYLWAMRSVPDPRFVPAPAPLPPPTTTTTTPAPGVSVAPTTAPIAPVEGMPNQVVAATAATPPTTAPPAV